MPPEADWFANLENRRTQRAYRLDIQDFMAFVGIQAPEEFRVVTRGHVVKWRKTPTIRWKLAALSSVFNHLCDSNAVTHNPVKGVPQPKEGANEGKRRRLVTARRGHS